MPRTQRSGPRRARSSRGPLRRRGTGRQQPRERRRRNETRRAAKGDSARRGCLFILTGLFSPSAIRPERNVPLVVPTGIHERLRAVAEKRHVRPEELGSEFNRPGARSAGTCRLNMRTSILFSEGNQKMLTTGRADSGKSGEVNRDHLRGFDFVAMIERGE
jgi:hypothetical protein